jgi:dihydroxy-acid dehydratase
MTRTPQTQTGLREVLTSSGDDAKAFIKAAGYSDDALSPPLVGITNTCSAGLSATIHAPHPAEPPQSGIMPDAQGMQGI